MVEAQIVWFASHMYHPFRWILPIRGFRHNGKILFVKSEGVNLPEGSTDSECRELYCLLTLWIVYFPIPFISNHCSSFLGTVCAILGTPRGWSDDIFHQRELSTLENTYRISGDQERPYFTPPIAACFDCPINCGICLVVMSSGAFLWSQAEDQKAVWSLHIPRGGGI